MARPPLKPSRKTSDPLAAKPNREAILTAQKLVDSQLPTRDSDSVGDPSHPGAVSEELRTGEPSEGLSAKARNGGVSVDLPAANDEWIETQTDIERHEKRLSWFYAEASRQAHNRREMAIDEAFYDSKQWDREDEAVIRDRGQDPVVYNEVKPTIDFLIGTERRSRVDFYVVAEDDGDEASEDAINKTKLLKYLDDTNQAPFERSYAADDSFKAGLGVLEVGLRNDKTGVPIYVGHVPWREYLHDSRAKKDQSDARYNLRVKEIDLDVAIALFPQHEEALRADSVAGDDVSSFRGLHGVTGHLAGLDTFTTRTDGEERGAMAIDVFNARERVTIIECWSREPVRRRLNAPGLGDPLEFRIRVALMTETKTLLEAWSPFKHDSFPFVLVWAYRDAATGLPYGPVRPLRGPQKGLNKRMTRAIFESSFNQMEAEIGAIDDEVMTAEELQAEANDPTGLLIFAAGALSGNRVRQRNNTGNAREQALFAEADRQTLRQISSVNEENRGLQSQATSRVAMDAKAERGSIGTAELFDNQLLARQKEGELTLSLAEQFVKAPMTIRVAGEQGAGKVERTKINQPSHFEQTPEGIEVPVYVNDITKRRAHFVVGEQAWKQSYAESAFGSLMQIMTQLAAPAPQLVVGLLDVLFDMHPNLPRKKVVIERIRAINGQSDPDGKVTPEQAAKQQKDAAIAQAQFELQMAQLQAEVHKAKAQGDKLNTDSVVARVTALYEAAQAAQVLALAPGITPITDQLLASAGFQDQAGSPQTIVPQPVAEMPTDPAAQAATGAQGRMQALMPQLQQSDGIGQGSETMRADGIRGM